jgi:SPP1 gp7 family putative phage head morphogenesis protein
MVVDESGKDVPEITKLLESTWFYGVMEKWIAHKFYGTGLIELQPFGDYKFAIYEIPRTHLIPEKKLVTKQAGGKNGIIYTDPSYANNVIQCGSNEELGILNKLVPLLIWKRNAQQAWAEFSDRFGLPFRSATTTSRNTEDIDAIEEMLQEMGLAGYGVFPEGTTIDFKEVRTGDAFNVFDQQILRCNTEISKAINGGTMLSDDGASYSQSETQLKVFQFISKADQREFKFFCNDTLFPILIEHGLPLEGKKFEWDDTERLGIKEKFDIVKGLLNTHDVSDEDLTAMFGIKVTKKVSQTVNFNQNPKTATTGSQNTFGGHHSIIAQLPDYGSCCQDYSPSNALSDVVKKWLSAVSGIFESVYKGEVSEIPFSVFDAYSKPLNEAFTQNFHRLSDADFDSPDHLKAMYLQANLFHFSSAKTWQDMITLNKLAKEHGNYTDFRNDALKYGNVVLNHLQTEYEYTRAFATGAANYLRAYQNKDISDLMYKTVGDSRVRKEHQKYDGFVAAVDDPVWDWLTTPNGWKCRCDIVEVAKGKFKSRTLKEGEKIDKEGVPIGFRQNPAKLDQVFDNAHAYFKGFDDFNNLNRKKYGLENATQSFARKSDSPKPSYSSQAAYEEWWNKEAKKAVDDENIYYKNFSGIAIKLPKNKLFDKFKKSKYNGQNRQGIGMEIEKILSEPDEVWLNINSDGSSKLRTVYLKNYQDGWYACICDSDEKNMTVTTWYKVAGAQEFGNLSNGLILYKK